jgi:hypothetical protein
MANFTFDSFPFQQTATFDSYANAFEVDGQAAPVGAGSFAIFGRNDSPANAELPIFTGGVAGYAQTGVGVLAYGGSIGVAASGSIGVSASGTPGVLGSSFDGGEGVEGTSQLSNGVHGTNGAGATAKPIYGCGVYGESTDGYGVWGGSNSATAVFGDGGNTATGVAGTGNVGVYGTGQLHAAQFDGHVQVNGDHHVTGTMTVDIDIVMPAQDCAEDFDVAASTEIEPGTVMALDDGGSLRPSDRSYDKKVAGVISGAGEFRPGMVLGRCDSVDRRAPLALMGKVYCKVDAQYGPIEVGDLLTTSPTSGHAMRAADPSKAFGAVIGKALRQLSEGCGLIPILVALQ